MVKKSFFIPLSTLFVSIISAALAAEFSASVSNLSPYKNEPFTYRAYLSSKLPLYNVQTQKIQVEDAIVELLEEPKLEEKVIDGILLNVVEFSYLITPLKAGSLTISPIAIQGAIPQRRKGQEHNNLFFMMQGFNELKPFTLMTKEIEIDIQPAIPEVSPWLPAKALTLEEEWRDNQTLRVGEPFSRTILIKAEGLKASQLPHLEEQSSAFKVYADKPEDQEKVLEGVIESTRKNQYTIIPQKDGTCILPEISISWWDTVKKEKRTATLPAHALQILPALEARATPPQQTAPIPAIETPLSSPRSSLLLYYIIGILACFLIATLLWIFSLQRKMANLSEAPTPKPEKKETAAPKKPITPPTLPAQKEKKEKLPDLNPT